jgi:AcrR family transcriptional regulator
VTRRSQEDRSRATRADLVGAGRRLFAERGFQAVPAEEILRVAGVTQGALRHHFGDERDLFRAVFEELEAELAADIAGILGGESDTWAAIELGVSAFLDACERPELLQIALRDAPAVLGWSVWREIQAEHGLGLIKFAVAQAVSEGLIRAQPVDVLAHLLLGSLIEAALLVAEGAASRRDVEQALYGFLDGMRVR